MTFQYDLVLLEPLIPPNTGNAGRLSVATNSRLHLVEPLGFSIDDKQVRRAGLDYWKHVQLFTHKSFEDWLAWYEAAEPGSPFFLIEDHPMKRKMLFDTSIPNRAAFVFGKETVGIDKKILEKYPEQTRYLPMFSDKIRSLNLSNTVSIVLYEAIRQQILRSGVS